MYAIDSTQDGLETGMDQLEMDQFEYSEESELIGPADMEAPLFDEAEEMELASDLLGVSNEAELDQFLGNFIRRAGRVIGRVVKSPVGRALGGILKGAARQALPIVGGAIGSAIGGPAGGAIGTRLAPMAGRLFGLELEGLSPEDQEFEVARRFVRFSGGAVKRAALAPPSTNPQALAKSAVMASAKLHAPGLIRKVTMLPTKAGAKLVRTGRWFRRGRNIIIINC
jgi:uncharacterized protein (DUF697 family)